MCLPVSTAFHQQLIAFWQLFPIWTLIVQSTVRFVASRFTRSENSEPSKSTGESYLRAAAPVYRLVFALCMITHVSAITIVILPSTTLLGYSSMLTRLLRNDFADAFVPYGFDINYKVSSLAAGTLTFLQWDIYVGSAAFLIWVSALYRDAVKQTVLQESGGRSVWWNLAWKIPCLTLISGPVGAVTVLLSERDKTVRKNTKKEV